MAQSESSPRQIFRDEALERLSTPEQLDQLIHVTNAQSWIALAATLALIAGLTLWGFLGTVVTRVDGQGILLGGDIYDVVPLSGGQVMRVLVGVGDVVSPGAVVAEVDQPALRQQLESARARLADLRLEQERLRTFGSEDVTLQKGLLETRRRNLEQTIAVARGRAEQFESQIESDKELAAKGLVTREVQRETQRRLEAAREEMRRAAAELQQIDSQDVTQRFSQEQRLTAAVQRSAEAQRALESLERDYQARTKVLSPRAGRVVALMAAPGDLLAAGVPIVKLDVAGAAQERLQAIIYVDTDDGKKIVEGMEIRVAPASVKPEEHGYIIGRVTYVATFPATTAGMMHVLKNDRFVQQLMTEGAPFEVRAELLRDPEAKSGYRWTSAGGPPLRIAVGTPCKARISVRTQRPAELVVPGIRRALRIS